MNPPKPTALRLVDGSAANHPERVNREEPQVDALVTVPEPPRPLRGQAKAEWARLAAAAVQIRVLSTADLAMLTLVCEAFADYQGGETWRERDAARRTYLTGLREFGLSPSSRTRVHAVAAKKDEPLAGLLAPRRKVATS